jgi:8-oxo-dGTP pyrophosphatase MutT (NUDIX family)
VGDKDPGEAGLVAAKREVEEETGFEVQRMKMLSPHYFPLLPGQSTEVNAFAVATAKDTGKPWQPDEAEKAIIVGTERLPLKTFADTAKFKAWIDEKSKEGYLIGNNVFFARALMPPLKGNTLDLDA